MTHDEGARGDANAALVRMYLDRVWARRDLAAMDQLLDPEYRRHLSPTTEALTIDGQRVRLAAMQDAFPDVTLELADLVADGDLVAFRSVMRGTHRAPFRGLPATDRPFEVYLVDIVRIRDGRFVEHWGGPDLLDLLTQLGATVQARSTTA